MSHDNFQEIQIDALSSSGRSDEILTVPEVARRLRVATSWVYANADLLGAFRLGKYIRFSWGRVLSRLEQRSVRVDVGVTAQRPSREPLSTRAYVAHGTTKEQKPFDI